MKWINPFLNNPLTDFCYIIAPNYRQGPFSDFCSDLELKLMDCLEAHGFARAKQNCAELVYDFHECSTNSFQKKRARVIQEERMRQYRQNKLKKPFEEYPNLESFLFM